jgi:hypothetical protein
LGSHLGRVADPRPLAEKPVVLGPPTYELGLLKEQFEKRFPAPGKLPDGGEEELQDYLEEIYKNMRQAPPLTTRQENRSLVCATSHTFGDKFDNQLVDVCLIGIPLAAFLTICGPRYRGAARNAKITIQSTFTSAHRDANLP